MPDQNPPAPTWPDDWNHTLDTAIRTWRGNWDTKRVQHLYQARYRQGLFRAHAREFLALRARRGLMTSHEEPTGRHYTLNSRKDVRP